MGEMISFGVSANPIEAYLSLPAVDQAPAILMFHAWWGLNSFFKETADRFSETGLVALAPDYYQGQIATTIDEARILASQMDRKAVYKLARQSLEYLLDQDYISPKQVAVLGISLGCRTALELARRGSEAVKAVVLFYGTGGGKFDSARADFLGHFAEQDSWGPDAKQVAKLEKRLSKGQGEVHFYTSADTQHWFFERDRPDAYNEQAAKQAWDRTIDFLKARLF